MLLEFCKECRKCCDIVKTIPIFLSEQEYEGLKSTGKDFKVFKVDYGYLLDTEKGCPFVSNELCTLSKELKPLDCAMFPLICTYKNDKWEFHISDKCPYKDKISKQWIEETKKEFFERIENRDEEAMGIYNL